jgi:pilus assembly protein Flp/PilA
MVSFLQSFLHNDDGASAAEYALVLALLGSGIAIAAFNLSETISDAMLDTSVLIAN